MQTDQPNQTVTHQNQADNIHIHHAGNAAEPAAQRCSLPTRRPFFGREEELARIAEALSPDSRSWGVLIDGPGGIGKTALAIEAGHLAPTQHFALKVFLSAKVRELLADGEAPLDDYLLPNFMALLSELARELGESNIERLDPQQRANSLRRSLANYQALLVIDNLETFQDAEQKRVFQFLDKLPASCKALVTSRRRTDTYGGVPIRLDRLQQPAALQMLANLAAHYPRLARADERERVALYEATTGNPLLIRWTVGQLGRGHCATVKDACEFLHHAPPDNDPLEYIFGDLLDTFTDSESAALSALVHFRGFAEVKWLATLADLPAVKIQTAVEDLADRALLLADANAETFHLPPLAAKFIRNKRPEPVRQSGERLDAAVYALVMENGYEEYERFPELEAEWETIAAALPRFIAGDNEQLQAVCDALDRYLEFSGRWDERLWLFKQAEARADTAKDFYNAGWRAYWVGWIYQLRGIASEVLVSAERAKQHWEEASTGTLEKAAVMQLLGLGHRLNKDYVAALDALHENLKLERSLTNASTNIAGALNDIAETEHSNKNYEIAEQTCHEALQMAKKLNDTGMIATYTGNLAELALDKKSWAKGHELAQEALTLSNKIGRKELIAANCRSIAQALAEQQNATEGLPYAQRAVEIFTQLQINPEEMQKAQQTLQQCEAQIAAETNPQQHD